MKKFIALLLGAILCFSLMACEGTGESSASSTTNSTVGEQEESPLEKQYQEIKEYLNDLSVVYDYESEQGLTGKMRCILRILGSMNIVIIKIALIIW